MNTVLIVGAKSDMAKAIAREFAKEGFDLCLAARDIDSLQSFKSDLTIKYEKSVELLEFDVADFDKHDEFWTKLKDKVDGVIVVSGIMFDQKEAELEWDKSLEMISVNYSGAVSLLNMVANDFEKKKNGFIIGISSVAGDRGRKANYIYGSTKAAFSTYLSGLRNRLFEAGVQVITVKPGFVYTKMTEHLDLPQKLTATPEEVAKDIFKAYSKKKDILYTKSVWRLVMCIIRHIPESIFKRMSI